MAYTKAQRRITDARYRAAIAFHRADESAGRLLKYEPTTRHRVFVHALFPAWNETVKELLARLSFAHDECAYHKSTLLRRWCQLIDPNHRKKSERRRKTAAKWRGRFESLKREFMECGMLEILDRVEREIIDRAFLKKP